MKIGRYFLGFTSSYPQTKHEPLRRLVLLKGRQLTSFVLGATQWLKLVVGVAVVTQPFCTCNMGIKQVEQTGTRQFL